MDYTPGAEPAPHKKPPLHARLFWYQLSSSELALLKAMVEHCWDGSVIWASIQRLSAYSKLSEKQVQRLIHGYNERRQNGNKEWIIQKHNPGLVQRGILTMVAKANPTKMRPATYRLNEGALIEDPKMFVYRRAELQEPLPGIYRPSVPGEPVRPRQKVLPGIRKNKPAQKWLRGLSGTPGDTVSGGLIPDAVSPMEVGTPATLCREGGDAVSPDYLINSRRGDSSLGFECDQKRKVPTTTATFPDELAQGLREFVPDMDKAAMQRIWDECRKNAPDCGVGELLYFAGTKAHYLPKASNPTGFLISALAVCVTEEEVSKLRQRWAWDQTRGQQRQAQAAQEAQQMAEWEAGALERDRQRAEQIRLQEERQAAESRKQAEMQQAKQEAIHRATEALDQMPVEDLEILRAEAIQKPRLASYLDSVKKLVEHGMASNSIAEPHVRQTMIELLIQRMEGGEYDG